MPNPTEDRSVFIPDTLLSELDTIRLVADAAYQEHKKEKEKPTKKARRWPVIED